MATYPENPHVICQAIIDLLKFDTNLNNSVKLISGNPYYGINDNELDPGANNRPAFIVSPDTTEDYETYDANGKKGDVLQDFYITIYTTGGDDESHRKEHYDLRHRIREIIHNNRTLSSTVYYAELTRFESEESIDEQIVNYKSIGIIDTRRKSEL